MLTETDLRRIGPKAASLNTLIQGMVERTTIDSEEAWKLMQRLQDALNKEFKLSLRLERKPV
jgi:hypothetical protein